MIRLLVKLGRLLDARFPEKRVVTVTDYEALWRRINALDEELTVVRQVLKDATNSIEILVSRIGTCETNAVHKGAVQDLVAVVKTFKEEMASLKAGLGMNRVGDADIRAMLNGLPVEEDTNG